MKDILPLMRFTEGLIPADLQDISPVTSNFRMTALLPRVKPISFKIIVFFLAGHVAYCFLRLRKRDEALNTMNMYYFGFDTKPSLIYELINISQFFMAFNCYLLFFGFPCLYAFLVCIACAQLEKVRANFLDIKQNKVEQDSSVEIDQEENDSQVYKNAPIVFRRMKKQMNNCIHYHQETLEYVKNLEEAVNLVLMGHFLLILGGMCFSAFSFAMSFGNILHMGQAFMAYLAFLFQLYIYCWFGTELTTQAESVKDAVWGSDWVGTSVAYQRHLCFIIAKADKEFYLTAGKFVQVSRKTMLNVINQTISYLMFLLNVKDN